MLLPNNKQKTKLFQCANTARFAYNWALDMQMNNFKDGGKFISDSNLRKEFTKLKQQPDYNWLYNVSNNVTKQAIKDCCDAYSDFFAAQKRTGIKYTNETLVKLARKNKKPTLYNMNGHPKFKSKKYSIPTFYQDTDKIKFTGTHVKMEGFSESKKRNKQKLNWIRLAEKDRIPTDGKYINPRISYDGINWWISVGIEVKDSTTLPSDEGIGIDLGIKDLAICSDIKDPYKNINKTSKVKKSKKKQRRLQRKISRKYLKNKKGDSYCKTSNIIKSEKELLKINHRLADIRHNYIHQTTTEIIERKPSFICMEDLNVKGMMKNKHLSKAIQEQCLNEFQRQIEYKSSWNNIKFIEADRYFPSSKLCSVCGCINKNLKLSDRVYICPECGNVIDRDYQAALNLKAYGENVIQLAS